MFFAFIRLSDVMNIVDLVKSKEIRPPLAIAWGIALVIAFSVPSVTGQIYGSAEAKDLLLSVQKASLYYGSAVATASATILALMLTILSFTDSYEEEEKDKKTFIRLHAIAAFCVYSFIGAIILLLCVSFPVNQFEKIPSDWFSFIYYLICAWNGLLAGHMITTILILRDTATQIIGDISPDFNEKGEEKNKDNSS